MVVTIPVQCPHCETIFQLSPDLAGKSMRCPNPDCREVFEVKALEVPVAAPPVAEPSEPVVAVRETPTAGQVSDFVPVLEVEESGPAPGRMTYARVDRGHVPAAEEIPEADAPAAEPLPTA